MKNPVCKLIVALSFSSAIGSASAIVCDVDNDNDIDKLDVRQIFLSRGNDAVGNDDPRDENSDGVITIGDGRACQQVCTLPRCAEPAVVVTPLTTLHFFSAAEQGGEYFEPWRTDGTVEGTFKLKEINLNGRSMSSDAVFVPFNGKMIFTATDDGLFRHNEFWQTDGQSANTIQISHLQGSDIAGPNSYFIPVADKILFNSFNSAQGFNASHQFTTDHQASFLSLTSVSDVSHIVHLGEQIIFSRWIREALDYVAHIYDGTTIEPIVYNGEYISRPNRLTLVNSKLLYFTRFNRQITTLWSVNTDGSQRTALGDFVEIDSSRVEQSDYRMQMAVLNGKLYFNADDGERGHTLWVSNGTTEGTRMVKDLDDSEQSTEITSMQVLGNKIIFSATGTAQGLWVSDGSALGTVKISDFAAEMNVSETYYSPNPVVANNLYFYTAQNADGYELWASDGTAEGTSMVKDINVNGDSSPVQFVAKNGYVLFAAMSSSQQAHELWRSDGTEQGTFLLKDICPADYCTGLLAEAN